MRYYKDGALEKALLDGDGAGVDEEKVGGRRRRTLLHRIRCRGGKLDGAAPEF